MPQRPCLKCGALTREGSWCPAHTPPPWRNRSASSRAAKRPGWNKLRDACLHRDGNACVVCGATEGLAAHHLVPVAEGGPNVLSNLQTLCSRCHAAAH